MRLSVYAGEASGNSRAPSSSPTSAEGNARDVATASPRLFYAYIMMKSARNTKMNIRLRTRCFSAKRDGRGADIIHIDAHR